MSSTEMAKNDLVEIEFADLKDATLGPQTVFDLSEHDKKVARRLKWKIDLWTLPMITFIYLLAAMDRSDIGNAQVAGMQKDIDASNGDWANIVSLFYVGFVLGQAGGVYTLRSLTPQIVLGGAVVIWGVAITCMIKVTNPAQAEGLRIIIGFCEGLDHAALLYLSLYYTPKELATRSGIFYSASSLAGAFNGLMSYGIVHNYSHKVPFEPWQWLFLIEGVISIGYGVLVLIFLPPVPEKLRWGFTQDEKRLAVIRTQQAHNTPGAKIRWKEVLPAFKSPMLYVYTMLLISVQICLSGLSSFLPALVKTMGYSAVQAQLMTVPVYAVAFVATLFFTNMTDRTSMRGPWLMFLASVTTVGLIILITVESNHAARYAGICMAAMGMYPSVIIITTWLAINTRNYTHRATGSAITNMVAQSIVAGTVQAFNHPPYYYTGLKLSLAFVASMIPVAAFGSFYVAWKNKKKDEAIAEDSPEICALRLKSFEELGSDHPNFRYEI
jgi:Major Facilitator Superfamily